VASRREFARTDAAHARAALAGAGAAVVNPLGEAVQLDRSCLDAVDHDPERAALVPAMLTAVSGADEIWSFEQDRSGGVEHRPHLLSCSVGGVEEVVVAGTRRSAGSVELVTWFRAADARALLGRYRCEARLVHPVRRFRTRYARSRDVLCLTPEEPCPYRVERFAEDACVLAYVAARGLPTLVGLELQGAKALLASPPAELRRFLASCCELDGQRLALGPGLRLLVDKAASEP
jgi:hypothetical protein